MVKHYQNINSVKYVNSTFQLYIINKRLQKGCPQKRQVRQNADMVREHFILYVALFKQTSNQSVRCSYWAFAKCTSTKLLLALFVVLFLTATVNNVIHCCNKTRLKIFTEINGHKFCTECGCRNVQEMGREKDPVWTTKAEKREGKLILGQIFMRTSFADNPQLQFNNSVCTIYWSSISVIITCHFWRHY